uniref:hypothetical protein n=1 Tax=Piscinibacter sp. TaxID=1903157 RepID=UPI0037834362
MLQAAALDDLLTPSLPVADIMRQLQMPDGAAALIGSEEALRLEAIAAVGDRPARLAVGAAVGLSDVRAAAPQMD